MTRKRANSIGRLLNERRYVIAGPSSLASGIGQVMRLFVDPLRIDEAQSEDEACEYLSIAGQNAYLCDSTHLVSVSVDPLTPEFVYSTHCRTRSIPGWAGGVVFVGRCGIAIDELRQAEPFNNLSDGHAVLDNRLLLVDLLSVLANLQPLYPNDWDRVKLSIAAFRPLRDFFGQDRNAQLSVAQKMQSLSSAIETILSDPKLIQLLPHQSVVKGLREVNQALAGCVTENGALLSESCERVRELLAKYL